MQSRHLTKVGTKLKIYNLSKIFGNTLVLHNLNLEVVRSEFVAIVGRSGCGKSTLLRLLMGLDRPSDGEIWIDDQRLSKLNSRARMIFQDARLLEWKRVGENVSLGLKSHKSEKAYWALDQVGLLDRMDDWPAILSGGQRQRVALARALVSEPSLLLLDEPLGALDALTRLEMQQLIENLWQEQKFTVLMVTHDIEEAVSLADRILLLESGEIASEWCVSFPRPRRRNPTFLQLATEILDRVLLSDQKKLSIKSS